MGVWESLPTMPAKTQVLPVSPTCLWHVFLDNALPREKILCYGKSFQPFLQDVFSGIPISFVMASAAQTVPFTYRQGQKASAPRETKNPAGQKAALRDLTGLFSGGEGGIRTHVPHHWGNSISSRARYDRFDTSPCGQGPAFRFPLQKSAHV